MTSGGSISLELLLNTSGFAGGINSAIAMLGTFQRAKDAAFKADAPHINVAQFQAEITGLNSANQSFQNSLREVATQENITTSAVNQNTAAVNNSRTTARSASEDFKIFGMSLKDAALGALGLQGGLVVIQQLKTLISDAVQEANKLQAVNLSLQNVANFKGVQIEQLQATIQSLDIVKKGLLSYQEAAQGVSNLMRSGLNLEQAINLLNGFTDSAVFGRQASLELGYAVVSGTEGWRNNNNMLLDNMGMTTNIAVLNKRAGLSEEELANKMYDVTIASRQYDEVMKELAISKGNAAKYAETFAGKQSQLNTEITAAKQQIGIYIQQGLAPLQEKVLQSVESTMKLLGALQKLDELEQKGIDTAIKHGEAMGTFSEGTSNAITSVRDFVKELLTMNMAAEAINWAANEYERFLSLVSGPREATNNAPMGPELPPNFKRTGHGGDVPGHDIAGNSTITSKTKGSGTTKSELDTDYSRAVKELADTEKEFAKLKSELDAQHISWNENTKIIRDYIKAIDDLKKKIADMTTDTSKYQKAVDEGSNGLLPGTLKSTSIELQRGDGTTPMSRFMKSAKTKEEASGEVQSKEFLSNMQQFNGGLMGMVNSLGLADTGIGQFTSVVSGGMNALSSFVQFLNSFGGGGGFDLLGSLFGAGLNFIAPGAGSVVAGAFGGGGGMGGLIRNNSGGGFMGNLGNLISGQSQKIVQVPYIADFKGSPEEFRVMVKSAGYKYDRMKGKK